MLRRRLPFRSRVPNPWQTALPRAAGVLSAAFLLHACTINYRNQHRSDALRVYHNGPQDHVLGLDSAWAESAIETLSHEFGLQSDRVTPVRVYVDCKSGIGSGSHFNRFTESIVLEEGQASLPFLFVHELTHLLLDQIDGSPPYWVDQGLAEYMESRAYVAQTMPGLGLGAAFLDRSGESVRTIGLANLGFRDYFSSEAVDGGWSWSVPMIHYLLRERWAPWPLPSRIRRLVELTSTDLDELAGGFLDYCRDYDATRELAEDYRASDGKVRLALLSELSRRFPGRDRAVLDGLLADEQSRRWRDVLARRILARARPGEAGELLDRLTPDLAPGVPLGEMSGRASRALVRHVLATPDFDPAHSQFPLMRALIARDPIARELLTRDRALAWFLGWPEAASFVASRQDVQEALLGRLVELDDRQLVAFLQSMRLVSFSAEGLFARGGRPLGWLMGRRDVEGTPLPGGGSKLVGSLGLEDRAFAVNRLEAPLRLRLRHRLERFQESAGARSSEAAAVRAALLAAYLGAEFSAEKLAGFAAAGEDVVAFACLFLEPSPCLEARRFFNGESRQIDRMARAPEASLAYYAPLLGLEVLRSTLVGFLSDSTRRDRALASVALFGESDEATRWLASRVEREAITDIDAFYLQQAGRADLCLRTDRSGTRVEVRLDASCRPASVDPDALRASLRPGT